MSDHGKYTILRKIADGGMAEIFLARSEGARGFSKLVVLKRIRSDFYPDSQTRNLLVDEAHVAMSLNHSNIVHVLDLGETGADYFLAMELVDGWSLAQLTKRARDVGVELPPELALFIIAQVCRALDYAHAIKREGEPMGLVHRDISPQNILLSEHGEVKLTDFGIAKVRNRTEKTAAGVVKGKIAFMSPEQAQGAPLDHRSDLFSLGTILYFLATDRLPFAAPTDLESMVRIQAGEFPPPTKHRPRLKAELSKFILKAMAPAPSNRFQSAEAMLVEAERVMRSAYQPVGQTELKRWLDGLAAKDRIPPISREHVTEPPDAKGSGSWESVNESAIVPPTLPPQRAEDAPRRRREHTGPRRRGTWAPVLLVLAGVGLGAYLFARAHSLAPPPLTDPIPVRAEPPAPAPALLPPAPPMVSLAPVGRATADADRDAGMDGGVDAGFDGGVDAGTSLDAGVDEEHVADDGEESQLLQGAVDPEATVIGDDEEEAPDAAVPVPAVVSRPVPRPPAPTPAPAKPQPRPDTVSVLVQSEPPGAVVKVGKRVFGKTPIPLRFRTGILFEITFVKSGYVTQAKRYQVTTRQGQRVTAYLKRAPGRGARNRR